MVFSLFHTFSSLLLFDSPRASQPWQSPLMKTRELLSSVRRFKTVLGIPGGDGSPEEILAIGKYGLGTKRTLAQLSEFTGVDFRNGQLVDDRSLSPPLLQCSSHGVVGARCKRLQWVPFKPDAGQASSDSHHSFPASASVPYSS
jgi:hypothetical protein